MSDTKDSVHVENSSETSNCVKNENVESNNNELRYDPSTIINSLGFGPYQLFIISYTGVLFCAEACEITMLSLLLPEIKDNWNLSRHEESFAGSIVFIGMFLGNVVWGILGDVLGRRLSLGLSNSMLVVAGGFRAISPSFWIFNICGFISGFAIGGGVVAFTRNRGITLLNFELFWVMGAILESGLGWIVLSGYIFETNRWNWFVMLTLTPVVLGVFYLPCTPESLRYMYLKKDEYGMRELTRKIERMNCRKLPKDYVIDFDGAKTEPLGREKKKKVSLCKDLCRKDSIFLILFLSIFYISSSFCYYGVVLASPNFFDDEDDSFRFLACFVSSLAEFPGILIGTIFLALFSRKFTQFASFMASGLSLLFLAFPGMSRTWYLIMGFCARASVMASSCVIWVIAQESLPTSIRSVGCGIASSLGKVATVLSPLVAEEFTDNSELIPKIIFAIVSVVAGVLVMFYPLETKGENLSDYVGEGKLEEESVKFSDTKSGEMSSLLENEAGINNIDYQNNTKIENKNDDYNVEIELDYQTVDNTRDL